MRPLFASRLLYTALALGSMGGVGHKAIQRPVSTKLPSSSGRTNRSWDLPFMQLT